MLTYDELEHRIRDWALTRDDIRAVLVVGSRARTEHPADALSDLDLLLLTTDASRYRDDRSWLETFGSVLLAEQDTLDEGAPEWIAVYEGVIKGDFTFVQVGLADSLASLMPQMPFQNVLARGLRVLVDKHPQQHPFAVKLRPFTPPTIQHYEQTVANFLITATRVAKFIQRGDLWRAVTMLYCKMRFYLVTMLEWHAHVLHGADYDTWYDGRFLDSWADAETLAALPDLFVQYEATELQIALRQMVSLFRRLAQVVAHELGYDYPQAADDQLSAWLNTI